MKKIAPSPRVSLLTAALIALSGVASAQSPMDVPHLLYVPDNSASVDHAAIARAFEEQGFNVSMYAYAGEDRATYARRIAGEVRSLMSQGVAPSNITVVGGGSGSAITLLASAAAGNRHVNYVVLGHCDAMLKDQYRFHLAGNVLGIRDVADKASKSCRPLFAGAPRLRRHKDMVLNTGHGASLFSTARAEWMQPALEWTGGKVDVGEIKVTQVEHSDASKGSSDYSEVSKLVDGCAVCKASENPQYRSLTARAAGD